MPWLQRSTVLMLAFSLVLAACSDGSSDDDRPLVVVSTSVWAEVVDALDPSDRLRVEVLLPAGVDPHDFVPSAAQAADLRRADLIVVNGLGLEEGLADTVDAAGTDGIPVFVAGEAADPLPFGDHEDEDLADEDHADEDPHVWLDPVRIGLVARALAVEMDARFGDVGAVEAAAAYADRMDALAAEMVDLLDGVEDRRLVSNHDSFGYFADRFGFEVVGVVIPGGSTDAAPSSQELAALAGRIEAEGIRAIFIDTSASTTVAEALAAEFDGEVSVVRLVTAGPDGNAPTDTIEGFLLENARRIADALGAG